MNRYVRRSTRLQTSMKRNTKSAMPIRRVRERPVILKSVLLPPMPLMSITPVITPVMSVTLPCGIIRPTPERGYVHLLDTSQPDEPMYASIIAGAAREGNYEMITCCTRLYDDIQPKYLVLALDIAAIRGHLDCVEVLLEIQDTRWGLYIPRSTALSDAWNAGHYGVVRVLLNDGRFRARIVHGDGTIKDLTLSDIPEQTKYW